MKPEDFDLFAMLVKQHSGLMLTADKAYLLESRLLPVTRKYNLKSLDDLAQAIRFNRDEKMMHDVTEAMTTNESSFFRDLKPFRYFRKTLLPQLLSAREAKRHIRIWSAAASSGQEAYSLAMICAEEAEKLQGWKVDIIGTDLSHEMIERASGGTYSQFEVQRGLSASLLVKYFHQAGDKWQINDDIRQMVQFRNGNLLHDFGTSGTFDIVFCRNVLYYFDAITKTRVLESISQVMAADGILLLGNAETTIGSPDRFKPVSGEYESFVLESASNSGFLRQAAG